MSDIIFERDGRVAIVRFNRPQALNALNLAVLDALNTLLAPLDADDGIGCIIVTGSDKAFAAGADIKEMQERSTRDMLAGDWFSAWERFARLRTPVVAAVAGFALGGGCEVALMCDILIAAENARFGQPEVRLGIIPGMGGSQRLTRAVGKAKAADMILTGRMMDAAEAERCGLAARVVPTDRLMEEALSVAREVASQPKLASMMAKEAIGRAFETSLAEGLLFERRIVHALFSTEDQKEGMRAFIEKRKPRFEGR